MSKKTVVFGIAGLIILSIFISMIVGAGKEKAKAANEKIAVIHVEGVIMGGQGSGKFLSEQGGTDYLMHNKPILSIKLSMKPQIKPSILLEIFWQELMEH